VPVRYERYLRLWLAERNAAPRSVIKRTSTDVYTGVASSAVSRSRPGHAMPMGGAARRTMRESGVGASPSVAARPRGREHRPRLLPTHAYSLYVGSYEYSYARLARFDYGLLTVDLSSYE
jgi:hypothetical protein